VYRLGSTPNGVFGAKIHWNNLRWALAKFSEMPRFAGLDRGAILHTVFPNLRVVDVTRRDRVRQAVSWARMAQDGMWVVYEELSSPDGYEQTIRGVLAHLGLDDYGSPIPAPRTRRQSNDLNEAWVTAYLTDRTSRPED
jgi:LPS sulfotransferase NodH